MTPIVALSTKLKCYIAHLPFNLEDKMEDEDKNKTIEHVGEGLKPIHIAHEEKLRGAFYTSTSNFFAFFALILLAHTS
ncbi:hypothetical protein ACJX0J_031312, partial [Zea mays]